MELKEFQKKTLKKLEVFFEETRLHGDPEPAFLKVARSDNGRIPIYRKAQGLERVPYVCLRLPTGGGKTIVGAHAIRVAAKSLVERDFPVVLWLVPTNTIRTQTATALKNPAHSYRIALDDAFEGRVRVFDISEIENIRPQDLVDAVCVVVGTIQTLRVEKTESRDVYAHKEALEPHFAKLKAGAAGLEKIEEGPNAGQVKYSFANLMALHHPVVIMDEAHNAHTSLSFDAFRRVSPSCIVELTATPDTNTRTGSNVLHRVSAYEVKSEEMIKLPVVLTVHPDGWEIAISDSLRTRERLAQLAATEADYIRPILLIQAENKDKPANVEAIKQFLVDTERVEPERIAIATGDQRELDDINLFDRKCPVDVIITVQALKEGWDCSFAYVFCSVANIGSGKDVEQLLGRVLRMPYARRRKSLQLNKAYAHVASQNFIEAAQKLESSMIEMGFDSSEAKENIEIAHPSLPGVSLFLQRDALKVSLPQKPDLDVLSEKDRQFLVVREETRGNVTMEVHGELTDPIRNCILEATPAARRPELEAKFAEYKAKQQGAISPAQRGETFRVPRLCVQYQGELELVDDTLLLDATGWDLLDCKANLSDFRFNDSSKTFEFDVDGSRLVYQFLGEQQLNLDLSPTLWTDVDLIRWLDKQLRQPDIRQESLLEWLRAGVTQLLNSKHFELATLVRAKFILVRKLSDMIKQCRAAAEKNGYQELLFGPKAAVETSYEYAFNYDPLNYPARWSYTGGNAFTRHFYGPRPGELESDGEEFDCAVALDMQSGIKHWVRNLSNQATASFWLQTSSDKFYPDFVAELLDGRLLVVEYKGELRDPKDTEEKRLLGDLWEAKSNGKGLFLLAERRDSRRRTPYDQIRDKIAVQ